MTDRDSSKHPDESATPPSQPTPPAAAQPRKSGVSSLAVAVFLLVALAVVLGGALWYQNQEYRALRADMIQQGGQAARAAQLAREAADEARGQVRGQAAQLEQLRGALDDAQSQIDDLDQALQMMTDSGSDLLLLNDIDRLVTIAQQQLSLDGNVANAIISLEVAQARLARANRPALASLQQSINGDVDRLRAVATVDVPTLSARLDHLYTLLGEAPLLMPDAAAPRLTPHAPEQPAAHAAEPVDSGAAWWRRLGVEAWGWTREAGAMLSQDLRALFEVRRVDDAAALLISPEQAQRFREGLQQRTLTAQLALMMHQPKIWQTELGHVAGAIDRRFDMRSQQSREALSLARALLDTVIETRLPTVDNSLDAVAAARDAISAGEAPSPDQESPDSAPKIPADAGGGAGPSDSASKAPGAAATGTL
ncbi:uroporphyrinogen-III C-methyltransferase [Castellaniella sp. GW247-6E4]|uniref:uroporphyrinogen-III C-methyltransferase n=1 Tax=Castellaniella sp. GW247-6E4 TaxID=3140380 RepID=UPI00331563B1